MNARSRFTRRRFLKSTSLFAASVPLILSSRLWAGKIPKPSERLTLGFIGLGKQGRFLLNDFLKRTETQVLAVCDVDTTRRESAKKLAEDFYIKNGRSSQAGIIACNDYRRLLAREDIDAIVIATPDHWHALIAIAAANARKDIYCEKPLCQSIHEARAMVNAVRKNKRVFQTGSQQRSLREFRVAVELIRNGVLGKVHQIEVAIGGPGVPCDLPAEPGEPGLDWDLWLGPAPARPYHSILSPRGVHDNYPNWRNYREYGGGMVTDWGAHHFDIIQWALNMDHSGPVEIFPVNDPKAKSGVRFRYANGTEVVHVPGNGITFFGSEGKLYVNRGKFELTLGANKKAESTKDLDAVTAEFLSGPRVKRVYASTDHKADWLACIRHRREPITGVEIGARSVTVCHLVNLAYYHGQPLKWNPRRERFTGGTGNVQWLDVPYRKPWKLT